MWRRIARWAKIDRAVINCQVSLYNILTYFVCIWSSHACRYFHMRRDVIFIGSSQEASPGVKVYDTLWLGVQFPYMKAFVIQNEFSGVVLDSMALVCADRAYIILSECVCLTTVPHAVTWGPHCTGSTLQKKKHQQQHSLNCNPSLLPETKTACIERDVCHQAYLGTRSCLVHDGYHSPVWHHTVSPALCTCWALTKAVVDCVGPAGTGFLTPALPECSVYLGWVFYLVHQLCFSSAMLLLSHVFWTKSTWCL